MEENVIEEYSTLSGSKIFQRISSNPCRKKNIILLHGWSFTSKNWQDVGSFDQFSKLGFNVYAPDYPGFGLSEKSEKYGIERGNISKGPIFIKDYMKNIGIDHAVLLGASMGGGMVLRTVVAYPDIVDAVIAV
ncbi:MAG: alpha/beta fold hydrolase, partial [Thermoplasmata archaeon]